MKWVCSDCGRDLSIGIVWQINGKPYCQKHFNKKAKPEKKQVHGVIEGVLR